MKKNFLKVAALLIAAMLMVVSCSQEVAPKTENNGLVEARLNVAYGRDLTVSGDTKQDGITLKYTMTPSWNSGDKVGDEEIYGIVSAEEDKNLAPDGSLGYVTPGLWTITVDAYGNDQGKTESKKIFTGTANVYFNDTTKTATVFLAPVNTANNKVTFEFDMQNLSNNMSNDYVLEYNIYEKVSDTAIRHGVLNGSAATGKPNVMTYKESSPIEALAGGFYRVNVSIYRKSTSTENKEIKTLVGGTTKGFLVADNASVKIGGNIEPSDYEKVSIDAIYVKVNTSFDDVTNGKFTGKVTYAGSDTNAKVTMSIKDTTSKTVQGTTENGYTYTVTDIWTSVSDGNVSKGEQVTGSSRSKEFTFTSPGYKNITCTTVYTITGKSTNDTNASATNSTYYFANTVSAQVYIDPASFSATPASSQTSGQ